MKVSPLPAEALAVALRATRATDGAVDPTAGSALEALAHDRDVILAGAWSGWTAPRTR